MAMLVALALAGGTTATAAPADGVGPGCGAAPERPLAAGAARPAAWRRHGPADGLLTLRLNIPAFRLDVVLDSGVVTSYGVAVGLRKYRTPTGEFAVHRVVWNPWWIPPDSPWAREDTVTPPGPRNPMGPVKLLFGGPYYLHGTPYAASIGRAASHGCIRMHGADAIALARLLQERSGVGPDDWTLVSLFADTVSLPVDLPAPVPLSIVYEPAEVRGDTLVLHPDVYARAPGRMRALALQALHGAGRDTTRVRARPLATALRRARTRHVAVVLDSLLPRLAPRDSIGRDPETRHSARRP